MFDFYPEKTYSRTEVMSRPTPVPAVNGVYFWWFKDIPPGVPTEGYVTAEGYTLLYVGISTDKRGKPNSRSNLRQRLHMDYSGNAAGSTLNCDVRHIIECNINDINIIAKMIITCKYSTYFNG